MAGLAIATIPYVVGPSCTGRFSCRNAKIGSADSSCTDGNSCQSALFSDVDLINSCNELASCYEANGNGAFDELIDCCNDVRQCGDCDGQCEDKEGLDIVDSGCVIVIVYCTACSCRLPLHLSNDLLLTLLSFT